MQAADVLLAQVAAFEPVNDDWRPLDDVLCQLWLVGVREEHLRALVAVFERIPDEDGAEVLWGIVHGIEDLPFDYRIELDQSIARRPSLMANLIRQRLKTSLE